ncbi:hypothetical protein EV122DRAFT_226475 [Schizophyllum commune]
MARQTPIEYPSACAPRFATPPPDSPRHHHDALSPEDSTASTSARSPVLNADVLPAHPNAPRWAASDGRPPMAFLAPPPRSDAVTHANDLLIRLVALELELQTSPLRRSAEEVPLASDHGQALQPEHSQTVGGHTERPPLQDPSAHPGFWSLPFWVPPRKKDHIEHKGSDESRHSVSMQDEPASLAVQAKNASRHGPQPGHIMR